jgi:hypothetical protein
MNSIDLLNVIAAARQTFGAASQQTKADALIAAWQSVARCEEYAQAMVDAEKKAADEAAKEAIAKAKDQAKTEAKG